MKIEYTIATEDQELQQILDLQQQNLPNHISASEKRKEGFVTVEHNFKLLKLMNNQQPHCIAKAGDQVIGYALCMTKNFRNEIDILAPMFEKIDAVVSNSSSYMVMGQICISKTFRKKGVFRGLYQFMKTILQTEYDILITEVAAQNTRSLSAHYAIGFKDLLQYNSGKTTWHLIGWDMK